LRDNSNIAFTYDRLNRLTGKDPPGSEPTITYGYNSENMLVSATGGVTLAYDPLLRLYQTAGGTTTRMLYDGQSLIAEYDGSNSLQRRYVHGPGVDEPLVWYQGTGTGDRRFYHVDERGSVVATSDSSGAMQSYALAGCAGVRGAVAHALPALHPIPVGQGHGRILPASRPVPARRPPARAARFRDADRHALRPGSGERGGPGAGAGRAAGRADRGDIARRIGLARGGLRPARLFQPCRSETPGQ
jgi:hypothetical protein